MDGVGEIAYLSIPAPPVGGGDRRDEVLPLDGEPVPSGSLGPPTGVRLHGVGLAGQQQVPVACGYAQRPFQDAADGILGVGDLDGIGAGLGCGVATKKVLHPVASGDALVADAYGPFAARPALVETILWWQDRCWRGIDASADAGEAAMVRLRERGAVDDVRAAYEWTSRHRSALEGDLP